MSAAERLDYRVLDVFTTTRFSGNPLAVVFDADALTPEAMLAITREFGFSESAFVSAPANPAHDARLRIFTPMREIPFAGHPNIGAALAFAAQAAEAGRALGDRLVFEEAAGLVEIRLERDGAGVARRARLAAPLPFAALERIAPSTVAECLGLGLDDVSAATPPTLGTCGLAFGLAELASLDALGRAAPRLEAYREAARRHRSPDEPGEISFFVFFREDASHLRARMFAPLGRIPEDPATGSASAACAGLLASVARAPVALEIVQGVEMGRPSRIFAEARAEPDGAVRAFVSGEAVEVMRGALTPPDARRSSPQSA